MIDPTFEKSQQKTMKISMTKGRYPLKQQKNNNEETVKNIINSLVFQFYNSV